jgi:hypothetical protein
MKKRLFEPLFCVYCCVGFYMLLEVSRLRAHSDVVIFILFIIGIATKSEDFAEQSRLYFVFKTYSFFAELGRLRRAIMIVFCCHDLFILRRAGGQLKFLLIENIISNNSYNNPFLFFFFHNNS